MVSGRTPELTARSPQPRRTVAVSKQSAAMEIRLLFFDLIGQIIYAYGIGEVLEPIRGMSRLTGGGNGLQAYHLTCRLCYIKI